MTTKNQFKNIKVEVSCIPDLEKQIKQVFFDCLKDYSERFKAPVTTEKVKIQICFIEYPDPYDYDLETGTSNGLTVWQEGSNKILIQVRDPFLNDWENNFYVMQQFLAIMCHEFVHACQHLTGRDDIKLPKVPHDKKNDKESYFFSPTEIEARMLEVPYMCMYCGPLL
jgi:hypothetical protein